MQEKSNRPTSAPGSVTGFEEIDLALVDALQTDPRAAWSRIGPAIGVDATTAARRWARLESAGLAWVTAYAGPATATVGYVELICRPRQLAELSERLTALPWVISVEHVVGDFDLFLTVAAADLPALGRRVGSDIAVLPGVRSTRTRLGIRLYQEGSGWKVRALEPAGRARLTGPHTVAGPAGSKVGRPFPFGPRTDAGPELLAALGADGRAGWAELAARSGLSESTVRRRLTHELREREILLRCDLAQQLAGWPAIATYRAVVPHGELDAIGGALARLPQTRLCASVTGSCNLLFSVWLRGLDGITALESLLDERFPRLAVQDRTVTLRTAKRMGRVLDDSGRAIGHVPVGL
ncbi:Lrp/AsnC family transcriptional regulator [Streptomyces sp. NBC_00234]|uniref:Lrp/AsnC family transcriptional regulator n=1 Tax=Streptomyces sp. NBC_00234 TaxID=2903638 RepID=UPI002E284327|nr:Lrp/AsnC family transcriptional regulator [Streptomyces sp. NBC_00234]